MKTAKIADPLQIPQRERVREGSESPHPVPGAVLNLAPSRAMLRAMFTAKRSHLFQVMACLFLVYLSWGSTFIANKFALEHFRAFMLCGLRMGTAGLLLYGLTWLRGERAAPSRDDLRRSVSLALYTVFIASGFLSKAQESVSSGTAAMILGAVPIWMVLGGWLFYGDPKPSKAQFGGLACGFCGLLLISFHQGISGDDSPLGIALIFCAAFGWVFGSFQSKQLGARSKLSVMRTSALLMTMGGLESLLWALLSGEFRQFSFSEVSPRSWGALLYLIVFGAIIAYTCYFWLLTHTRTVVAISYEFVNPVIGVFLGWLLAGERVDATIVLACCMTVTSVFFVVSQQKPRAET